MLLVNRKQNQHKMRLLWFFGKTVTDGSFENLLLWGLGISFCVSCCGTNFAKDFCSGLLTSGTKGLLSEMSRSWTEWLEKTATEGSLVISD
ncbi:hypothetical protein LXL04_038629 [Taraxacum kok-saghyz]